MLGVLASFALAQDGPKEHVEPPFTAAQIREACDVGTSFTHRIERAGDVSFEKITFTAVTENDGTVSMETFDADMKPVGEARTKTFTWAQLEAKAHHPVGRTTVSDEEIKIGDETLKCKVYTVASPKGGGSQKHWYCPDLPGPPVRFEATQGDQVQIKVELVDHEDGDDEDDEDDED